MPGLESDTLAVDETATVVVVANSGHDQSNMEALFRIHMTSDAFFDTTLYIRKVRIPGSRAGVEHVFQPTYH